jgi:plasmid stability protein
MPSLTLKDIPLPLMEQLRARASRDQRSLNREAIWLLEQVLDKSSDPASEVRLEQEAQIAAWQSLAGRWQGSEAEVDDLLGDIYQSRSQGREFSL